MALLFYLFSFIDSTIGLRSESHAGMRAEMMLRMRHTAKAMANTVGDMSISIDMNESTDVG